MTRPWAVAALALAAALLAAPITSLLPANAASTSWTMDHLDTARNGNDGSDPNLGGSVGVAWTSPTLDGRIYGEPLYLNGLVYVATQNNSFYALNEGTGTVAWSLPTILPSVPLAAVRSAGGVPGCGNIDPMGIIGTPVIDPGRGTAGTLFAAAETWDGANGSTIEHRLVVIDLATHAVTSTATNIDPAGFTTGTTRAVEQERGALALAVSKVVVPYGGLSGDCGPYHGAAVSINEDLSAATSTFLVDATHGRGGIWGTGGPAADASGSFYVTTGNGNEPANAYDSSDGVIKLNSGMAIQSYFAPSGWNSDNNSDLDLGSMSPILIPRTGAPLVFATGKQHTGYLLDSSSLGGIGGQLFAAHVCDSESRGAAAYSAPFVYVPCSEGIRALTVDTATPSFSRTWQGPTDATGPPIIAGGRVWTHGNGRFYGLNASTGAIEVTPNGVNTPYNFGSASAGGGRIFFPAGAAVAAFTSVGPPPPPAWAGWSPLGGGAAGRVAVASNADGRLEGFWRGTDGSVQHLWQLPAGGWGQAASLGGAPAGDPAVGKNGDGRLEAFVVATDGQLWHSWQLAQNGGWTVWNPLGGSFVGRPSVVANRDGRLEAFVRGTDNAVWHLWQMAPNGGWSPPASLRGATVSDPGVGANADGRLEVFARRADNALWHDYQTAPNGGWAPWGSLGGSLTGSPAVGSNGDGRLEAFARGTDNTMWHDYQTAPNGAWSSFASLGGNLTSDPAVGRNATPRLETFAVDSQGQVEHAWQTRPNGPWLGWATLAGPIATAPPGVGANSDGRLELLVPAAGNAVWHTWQTAPA